MARPSKRTPRKTTELRRLHATGASTREIAELLGVSHAAIGRWLKELGLTANGGQGSRSTRPRSSVTGTIERAAEHLVADGLEGLQGAEAIEARRREVTGLIAKLAGHVASGEGQATAYVALSKLEADLVERRAALEPPRALDPAQDPLNVEEANKTRAKLARMVQHGEQSFRCAHCGRSPYTDQQRQSMRARAERMLEGGAL